MYVCMSVCMHACMYVCMYVRKYFHVCTNVCMYMCICVYNRVQLPIYTHIYNIYICVCVCNCIYIYVHLNTYICVYIYKEREREMCLCMHICTYVCVRQKLLRALRLPRSSPSNFRCLRFLGLATFEASTTLQSPCALFSGGEPTRSRKPFFRLPGPYQGAVFLGFGSSHNRNGRRFEDHPVGFQKSCDGRS